MSNYLRHILNKFFTTFVVAVNNNLFICFFREKICFAMYVNDLQINPSTFVHLEKKKNIKKKRETKYLK